MTRIGRRSEPAAFLLAVGALLLLGGSAFAGVLGSPHDFSRTAVANMKYRNAPLATAGRCSFCHIPHNALYGLLWPRSLLSTYDNELLMNGGSGGSTDYPDYTRTYTVACYDCHDYHDPQGGFTPIDTVPAFTDFETNHKPHNIAFGFSTTGTPKDAGSTMKEDQPAGSVEGYYENAPPYDNLPGTYYGADSSSTSPFRPRSNLNTDNATLARTGGHYFKSGDPRPAAIYKGDKLPCRDCHDPHAWDNVNLDWQAFFRPRKLYGYPSRTQRWNTTFGSERPRASGLMANPVLPVAGVAARDNALSRKLCILCHGTSDTGSSSVTYNEISDEYTSTTAIVRPPATIAEHAESPGTASCVSCHAHNNIAANCSQCHGFPPAPYPPNRSGPTPANYTQRDPHSRHFGKYDNAATASVYDFRCHVCHATSALGTRPQSGVHQDNNADIAYDLSALGVPNPPDATAPSNGGLTCSNVYCHSLGTSDNAMAGYFASPRWGVTAAPLNCNACHGYPQDNTDALRNGMPSYANQGAPGTARSNSHAAHVLGGTECSVCHAQTADGAFTGLNRRILSTVPTRHVDGRRNVAFDGDRAVAGSQYGGTGYDNAAKRCDVSCHGTGKAPAAQPQWGGAVDCLDCHAGTEAIYKPQDDYGTPGAANPVNDNEYVHSGHGRAGTNYPVSNNLPAGFDNASASPSDCYVCHAAGALHTTKSANDPFRLGHASDNTLGGIGGTGGFTGAWADNTDALCLGCHGTAAERSGHDNAADGTTTVDALIHARALMNPAKYNWPVAAWKCVDCHDPHGDGRPGAERIYMIRSAVNAPIDNLDANAGSDAKSRPRRQQDNNVRAVSFTGVAGYGAGSYAQAGNGTGGTWGICEVCHTQTTAYSRTLDNVASHASRTNRCTTCHPHDSGFAPTACRGCHGPDSVAATAPDIGAWWTSSGHGTAAITAARGGSPVECEECHDGGYLTASDHKTDGSAGSGPPPANINTLTWPGRTLNDNTRPNRNTSHLRADYFPSGTPPNKYEYALAFDRKCGDPRTGCHPAYAHGHMIHPQVPPGSTSALDNVNRFDPAGGYSVANPKLYYWYPAITTDYATRFYESRSPWDVNDLTTDASGAFPDNNVRYGVCVSCHDPHGTNAPANIAGVPTNLMLRGNSKNQTQFCNAVCHTSRPPD